MNTKPMPTEEELRAEGFELREGMLLRRGRPIKSRDLTVRRRVLQTKRIRIVLEGGVLPGDAGRVKGEIKARHPLVRELLEQIDARELQQRPLCRKAGVTSGIISLWREGRYNANLAHLDWVGRAMGMKLVWVELTAGEKA